MAMNGEDGKVVREAIERFVRSIKKSIATEAPFDKTKNGRIVEVTPTGYTVEIENKRYPRVQAIKGSTLQVNDIVVCRLPNNQMSQIHIVGKLSSTTVDNSPYEYIDTYILSGGDSITLPSDTRSYLVCVSIESGQYTITTNQNMRFFDSNGDMQTVVDTISTTGDCKIEILYVNDNTVYGKIETACAFPSLNDIMNITPIVWNNRKKTVDGVEVVTPITITTANGAGTAKVKLYSIKT